MTTETFPTTLDTTTDDPSLLLRIRDETMEDCYTTIERVRVSLETRTDLDPMIARIWRNAVASAQAVVWTMQGQSVTASFTIPFGSLRWCAHIREEVGQYVHVMRVVSCIGESVQEEVDAR